MEEKVLVNLATGLEDAERVTVAFLVATAALSQGKQVVIWATQEAVRLGLPGEAAGVACKGCPPLERLFEQFADGGVSCGSARSALAHAISTMPRRFKTPGLPVPRRCGNGPVATRLSSATEPTTIEPLR